MSLESFLWAMSGLAGAFAVWQGLEAYDDWCRWRRIKSKRTGGAT